MMKASTTSADIDDEYNVIMMTVFKSSNVMDLIEMMCLEAGMDG